VQHINKQKHKSKKLIKRASLKWISKEKRLDPAKLEIFAKFGCIQYKKKGKEHGGKSDQFSEKVRENPQKKRKTKIISELGL
jgi:hypothetical protein